MGNRQTTEGLSDGLQLSSTGQKAPFLGWSLLIHGLASTYIRAQKVCLLLRQGLEVVLLAAASTCTHYRLQTSHNGKFCHTGLVSHKIQGLCWVMGGSHPFGPPRIKQPRSNRASIASCNTALCSTMGISTAQCQVWLHDDMTCTLSSKKCTCGLVTEPVVAVDKGPRNGLHQVAAALRLASILRNGQQDRSPHLARHGQSSAKQQQSPRHETWWPASFAVMFC